jgi:DNA-directed RNA polymerase subunit RPC12/RpoP
MMTCRQCGRAFPEVIGEDVQECPHCGEEMLSARLGPEDPRRPAVDAAGAAAAGFRFARRHYGGALLLWVPALVVDVGADLALAYYTSSHAIPEDPALLTTAQQLELLGVAIPVLLATLVLRLGLFGLTAAFVLDRMRGAGTSLRDAARAPLRLLALGFTLMLTYVVGLLLVLVPFLVAFHWFQFAPAALADRRRGLADALNESRRFAREHRTFGFTALVLFVALGALLVDLALSRGIAAGFAAAGAQNDITAAFASAIPLWLVSPILAILPAAYWVRGTAAPIDPAPAPETSAAAARFRTTKCPQCGTLVPYESTGAPVDVACPSCGRVGRAI